MATWRSKPIKGSVEENESVQAYEFRWEYQTTADILTVFKGPKAYFYADYDHARLLWVLLDDWARSYLGEHEMKLLRKGYGTDREE